MVTSPTHPSPSALPAFQVNVTRARKLWGTGEFVIVMVGSNVNPYHVFDGWTLGATFGTVRQSEESFDTVHSQFLFYLDRELGRYARFYAIPVGRYPALNA